MTELKKTILGAIILLLFAPSAGFAASLLVSWNANSESDIAGYKVYCGTQSGVYSAPMDAGNATSFQLTNAQPGSTYYIALTAYNTANVESPYSAEIVAPVPILDSTIPTGTIIINSGSTVTSSPVVNLALSAVDTGGQVVAMKIKNDGEEWSGEGPYATTQSWALTTGDGVKTVYVMYKDAAGNWSNPVSATITLRLDTDGDGLPDAWEAAYGLDPSKPSDAALDSDLDGFSNLEEYYNNTNPVASTDGLPFSNAGKDLAYGPTRVYLDGSTSSDPPTLHLQCSWSVRR
jgi:hypothetical protein